MTQSGKIKSYPGWQKKNYNKPYVFYPVLLKKSTLFGSKRVHKIDKEGYLNYKIYILGLGRTSWSGTPEAKEAFLKYLPNTNL